MNVRLLEPYGDNANFENIINEYFEDLNICSNYSETPFKEIQIKNFDILREYNKKKDLSYQDYILKPSWILWILALKNLNTAEDYLNVILNKKNRYLIKKSLNTFSENEMYKLNIFNRIDETELKKFYELYSKNIENMKHGINLLKDDFNIFLENKDDFININIKYEEKIIGGLLAVKKGEMLRAIYLATDKTHKNVDVTRLLYYFLIDISIKHKYIYCSLGADPSIYGHMVSVGLYHIKKNMGFIPFPSKIYGEDSLDLYEKILRINKFNDIALSLGYADNDSSSSNLDAYIYYKDDISEQTINKVKGDFINRVHLRRL